MKIKVPATSANLGVGFDTLGISLSLYNEFEFTRSYTDELIGFEEIKGDNLVYRAYKAFLANKGLMHRNVKIELLNQGIPISRGLGSSASCVLAGVFAANQLASIGASFDECVAFAADLEGHPDNVFAAAYGGLCAVFQTNGLYKHQTFPIHKKLEFTILFPDVETSTVKMRKVLPDQVPLTDAVFNLSRIVQLPRAFEQGDIKLLKTLTEDKLHEQYRIPKLPLFEDILQFQKKSGVVVTLSGSGSALLAISDEVCKPPTSLHKAYNSIRVSAGMKMEITK
jgi:homoserine kinase